eukprot:291857-Alexandrium_andersonii.AAC.1
MSASLVGSEMCIRDSSNGCNGTASCASCLPCEAVAADGAAWVAKALGPVSYTHLTLPTICSV